jgi:rubrerythrin
MANTHQVIYIAATIEQAHMLKNALTKQGIFAYVSNESLQMATGDLPMGLPTAPRVVVDAHDADEARRIALEFDQAWQQAGSPSEELDELEEEADREAFAWPECPHCRRPRQTSCPVCETAGTDFPPAFMADEEPQTDRPAGEKPAQLVLCETCDEPFVPEFLARCEWCGHRFRDGSELPAPPIVTPLFDEVNPRVWIVIAGLALLLAATFATLFHIGPNP